MRCSDARPAAPRGRRLVACALALFCVTAAAHKASDSYLQIEASAGRLQLRWDIALRDLDVALELDADADGKLTWGEIRSSWPRIASYAEARLRIEGCPLAAAGRGLERRNDGAYAVLRYSAECSLPVPARIAYSLFAEVDPTHRGIAKIERAGQPVQLVVLDPGRSAADAPAGPSAGTLPAVPTAAGEAASGRWQFLAEGVRHILTGYDHVLFLLCLLLPAVTRRTPAGWQPVRRLSDAVLPIVGIVSAFTVAHSLTLAMAALALVTLPSALIEPVIAATIILAALDNVRPIFPVRRVVVAFAFGLIHGFGFAGVLAELQLPTADFAWALLQFNLGLELGQLLIVAAATTLLFTIRDWPRYGSVVIRGGSWVAMAIAGLWLVERTANLSILPV